MNKIAAKMNQPVYLALQNLDISKIVMWDCWYDYIKSKCEKLDNYGTWIWATFQSM